MHRVHVGRPAGERRPQEGDPASPTLGASLLTCACRRRVKRSRARCPVSARSVLCWTSWGKAGRDPARGAGGRAGLRGRRRADPSNAERPSSPPSSANTYCELLRAHIAKHLPRAGVRECTGIRAIAVGHVRGVARKRSAPGGDGTRVLSLDVCLCRHLPAPHSPGVHPLVHNAIHALGKSGNSPPPHASPRPLEPSFSSWLAHQASAPPCPLPLAFPAVQRSPPASSRCSSTPPTWPTP